MGEQTRTGQAAGNRLVGRRGCNHGVAGPTAQLLAPNHLEARRARNLGFGLRPCRSGASRRRNAGRRRRPGAASLPAAEAGQWPARRLLRLDRGLDHGRHRRCGSRQPLGLVGLNALDRVGLPKLPPVSISSVLDSFVAVAAIPNRRANNRQRQAHFTEHLRYKRSSSRRGLACIPRADVVGTTPYSLLSIGARQSAVKERLPWGEDSSRVLVLTRRPGSQSVLQRPSALTQI